MHPFRSLVQVTGARKGLGRGIAIALARAGCSAVAIVDIVGDEVTEAVVKQISDVEGCTGHMFVTDCRKAKELVANIDEFAASGGIDILVCNAMVSHSPPRSSQCEWSLTALPSIG